MGNKQRVMRILLNGYIIRTLLLLIAETVLFTVFQSSLNEAVGVLVGSLMLSVVSFIVAAVTSPDDRTVSPSASVLYAVLDIAVFSFGAAILAFRAMAGMQGGSGLAVVMIFIGAGIAVIPFSVVLAVITARLIRREIL